MDALKKRIHGVLEIRDKKITITGGKGFLGSHLVRRLKETKQVRNVSVADRPEYDLRLLGEIKRMYDEQRPEVVIHLAAVVGGIGANEKSPAEFFYDNLIMGIQLMHEAYLRGIEKFVALGTVCCYPKFTPVPFKEEYLWDGYPEETNAPYGLAKKMLLVQSQAYRKQYGFNSIFLMPANLFGPGDNFSPQSSHVIPALIRKFIEAKESGQAHVTVWGSGKASREFLFVEDAAEAIILATERYNASAPVNLGAGHEITIRELAGLIARLTGFKGRILWDRTKPDGQPRRVIDTSKAEREFGFKAKSHFEEELRKTIEWYSEARKLSKKSSVERGYPAQSDMHDAKK